MWMFSAMVSFQTLSLVRSMEGVGVNRVEKPQRLSLLGPSKGEGQPGWQIGGWGDDLQEQGGRWV